MAEHNALDSASFFDYLHPASGGVALYGCPEISSPSASSRTSTGMASSGISAGSSSSALFARLLNKRSGVDQPAHAGGASPLSKDGGGGLLSLTEHGAAAPSRLLSKVLGKRNRIEMSPSVSKSIANDDGDCILLGEVCGGNVNKLATSSSQSEIFLSHQFAVALQPLEQLESARAKRCKRGRGAGRARGRGRGRIVMLAAEDGWQPRLREGWRPLSLADVLFEIGEAPKTAVNTFWHQRVSVRSRSSRAKGPSAILEALRRVGIGGVFPYVAEASWPSNCEEWQSLPVGLAVWDEAPSRHGGSLCDCMFHAATHDDLSAFGGASGSGEALHVKLHLYPQQIAHHLVPAKSSEDDTTPCVHGASRCVEWRVVPYRKTKRHKSDGSGFRLLDNRGDPFASQPPHFQQWPLRGEQLRSLKWMQQCEQEAVPFDLILNQVQLDPGGGENVADQSGGNVIESAEGLFGWRYELRCREFYHIRGGILGDAMGYGKTATMIGLIDSRLGAALPAVPDAKEPYFFTSSATLVLVPSNLLDQWVSEFKKFLGSHMLRLVPIRTAAQLKACSVGQLCNSADVVLCSYRLLFSPVYRRRLLELAGNIEELSKSDSAAVRAGADVGGLRRNTRRFRESPADVGWKHRVDVRGSCLQEEGSEDMVMDPMKLRFPVLEQFWWQRVVFDEFHELEAMGNTAQFESLRNLCGHYRWGLTGTPPTRDLTQISVLARLFQINDLLHCSKLGADPAGHMSRSTAQSFLDAFARQNTSQEILPVRLEEHIVEVRQTPEERAIYLQALHDGVWHGGDVDTDDAIALAAVSSDSSERLLKLCSHFAYGVGAAASASADTECDRLGLQKEKRISRAAAALAGSATALELAWRLMPMASLEDAERSGLASGRESVLERLRERYGAPSRDEKQCSDDVAHATIPPGASSSHDHGGTSSGDPSDAHIDEAETACPAHAAEDDGLISAKTSKNPSASFASVFDAATSMLQASHKCESVAQLRAKLQSKRSSASQPLDDALLSTPADARHSCEQAQSRFWAAVQDYDAALRSHHFFANALAATRGEASAENRSCSICLDDDIPREQLSITSCAHIFHTECIREVAVKFGTCPVCRGRLDAAKDLTRLAAEEAPSTAEGRGELEADAEITKKFGSKLAAMAARLQAIKEQEEKAIVFCQWEDLKRKIAEALGALGLTYLELSGNVYQRSEAIRRFQEDAGPEAAHILLLSLEHSASGTNLTAANHVVFVHPMSAVSSERAVSYEAQAIGRCRRWGQTKSEVHCWRFVTRGTIEETITAEHQHDLWRTYLHDSKGQAPTIGGC